MAEKRNAYSTRLFRPSAMLETGFREPFSSSHVLAFLKRAGLALMVCASVAHSIALEAAGNVEAAFNVELNPTGSVTGVAILPDGRLCIHGYIQSINLKPRNYFAVLTADGAVDETFKAPVSEFLTHCAILPGPKILLESDPPRLGGSLPRNITQLKGDGSVDFVWNARAAISGPTFNWALQPDGKIVIVGSFVVDPVKANIARLNPDGTIDGSFVGTTNGFIKAVAIQPDGKIVIGGSFTSVNGEARNRIARLNPDGSLEPAATFNPGTGAAGDIHAIALQPDGKILIGGKFQEVNGSRRFNIARLNADGSIESPTTFSPVPLSHNSPAKPNSWSSSEVMSIALQTDGRILVAGDFYYAGPSERLGLVRLLPNGAVEPNARFNPRIDARTKAILQSWPELGNWKLGRTDDVRAVLQPDGRIVMWYRSADRGNSRLPNRILRLSNDPAIETLTVPNATTVYWMRGGSAPEISHASFDVSLDGGETWKRLGQGTRVPGGWQCAGVSLPAFGVVRAIGCVPSGFEQGNIGMVEKVARFKLQAPARR